MTKLISGIFLLIGGLVAFFVVGSFVGELNTTSWTATEITLVTILLPASLIIGSLLAVFIGIRRVFTRRFPPGL